MSTVAKEVGENRVILHPVSWHIFEQLLKDLGEDRASRLAYYEESLEIMAPLGEHENNNRFIDDLIRAIADELNLNLKKFGSLTLKRSDRRQGVEPDSCYYLQNEPKVRNKQNINLDIDPPPDLVLEIDITSGSLDKHLIYATLEVPEIWRYDGETLEVYVLQKPILIYNKVEQSLTFPWLSLEAIPRFIQQSLIDGETATLQAFRNLLKVVIA